MVGGYTVNSGFPSALLLGAYREHKLFYIGRAASGLSATHWQQLSQFMKEMTVDDSPFCNPPRGQVYRWLPPVLVVMVKFMEWTEALSLRAPVITGFSKMKPEECTF